MQIPARALRTAVRALLALPLLAAPLMAAATELGEPAGAVILTVSGEIAETNGDGAARFDLEMLRALPAARYETDTIWTDGTHVFEGVLLRDLMDAVGASGDTVRATALNDYAITIPVDGGDEDVALIAYHRDGEPMSVRNKGPLWIVYPYAEDARFRTEQIYARSIWQLDRIEVQD
jgi:hypothetical protein